MMKEFGIWRYNLKIYYLLYKEANERDCTLEERKKKKDGDNCCILCLFDG